MTPSLGGPRAPSDPLDSSGATRLPRTPPALALARRYYRFFALASGFALFTLWLSPAIAPLSIVLALFGSIFLVYGRLLARDAWGQAYVAAALQALTRGRFDEVDALHARIPAHSLRRGTVARAVAVQRALVALFQGAPDRAVTAIEPALAPRVRLSTRVFERMQLASAHGVRALAHAMRGDAAHAEVDATAAESYPEAVPEALARARLARAIVVSRSGDMAALGARLAKDGSLILEHTLSRERALVRALRKMAHGRSRSVYREPSKPVDAHSEPGALSAWIAQVAPEAAAYATEHVALAARGEIAAAPATSPDAVHAVMRARTEAATKASRGGRARRVVLVGALAAMFLALWQLFTPSASTHAGRAAATTASTAAGASGLDPSMTAFAIFLLALFALLVTMQVMRTSRLNRAMLWARRTAALGDRAGAATILAGPKTSSLPIFAAAAGASLAQLAEQEGDFERCLVECDAAIARLDAKQATRVAAEQLLPATVGLRAIALAAVGRRAESEAELASLLARFPSYAHLALLDFRIRFLNAVRTREFDAARAIAQARTPELPLPLRDELLADLVMATGPRGLPKEEKGRLDAELREDAPSRTWIALIAPDLLEEFGAGLHGVRGAQGAKARIADHVEPAADEEADLDVPAVVRRATLDP